MMGTLVGVLGVTFAGLMSSDTLCPDHRAWVQTLAVVGFMAMIGSLVGLIRGWAAAPLLTLFASSLGVAIGLIDAAHAPTRGRLVALGFGVALALAAAATVSVIRLRRWDRRTAAELSPIDLEGSAATDAAIGPATDAAPAEAAVEPADSYPDR